MAANGDARVFLVGGVGRLFSFAFGVGTCVFWWKSCLQQIWGLDCLFAEL